MDFAYMAHETLCFFVIMHTPIFAYSTQHVQ